ncbi:conserved hypothetical protein [Burkholderiales bacterium 8X]|nr:conserved hypothetical protein [Burkholderiales bacterium 8X]
MNSALEFNRVTFGLPVETFQIDAYIALEERLPVVTEFVLRLLKVCGRVPLPAIRDYFGFTDGEALAVIESLSRQGLLEVAADEAYLSLFALERFEDAGGNHPRFSKVELKSDTVSFDLFSFTPLRTVGGPLPTDNVLKLAVPDESLGQSVERAKAAYRHRYPEIASLRADLRERSFGVYSVEHVESKRRTYVPIPVTFSLDNEGQVERNVDEAFERIAPPALVQFVHEQVSLQMPKTLSLAMTGLDEFIDAFDLKSMRPYVVAKKFDVHSYLAQVHLAGSVQLGEGVQPVFGNLYLRENRNRIAALIRERRDERRHGRLLTSLAWLAPDHVLWGRGESMAQAVTAFSNELQSHRSSDALHLFASADVGQEAQMTDQLRIPGLRNLHFARTTFPDEQLMGGRLELLLYPAGFMVAVFHVQLPGTGGMWAPIGFASTQSGHLNTAHKLLRKAVGGRRYGRRARFNQKDASSPATFDEACEFLNYCGLDDGRTG